MNAIAPLSGSLGARPGGVATSPADEIDLEQMLLKLEQDAINYKIALRVQEVGVPSQPCRRPTAPTPDACFRTFARDGLTSSRQLYNQ